MNNSRLFKVAGLLLVLVLQLLHHTIPHVHPVTPSSIAHSLAESHHHHFGGKEHDHHHNHSSSESDVSPEHQGDLLAGILIDHTHGTHSHEAFPQLWTVQVDGKIKKTPSQGDFLASSTEQRLHFEEAASAAIFAVPPLLLRNSTYFSPCSLRAPPTLG